MQAGFRGAVGLVAVALLLTACGGGDDDGTVSARGQAGSTATASAPSTTVATGGPCTVARGPTGPITTFGFVLQQDRVPPVDWSAPPQEGFDWNGDGAADRLVLDPAGQVVVDWGVGSLTVTGVEVAFPDGAELSPVPAAVADVTADGALDLIVVHEGSAGVVVGEGPASETLTVAHDRIGQDVNGWLSPPIRPESPPGVTGEQPLVPLPTASVVPQWDLTGDGVADWRVDSLVRRADGPVAYYAGQACQ